MGEKNTSCKTESFSCVPKVLDACHSFKRGEAESFHLEGYRGSELAQAMECTQNVALNKLNPNNEHNTPTLKDAVKMTDHFDDDRILEMWASQRGYLLVKKVQPDEVDEEETLDAVLHLHSRYGNLSAIYHKARADGVIDPDEYNEISHAAYSIRKAVAIFESLVSTQVRKLPKGKGVLVHD